MNAQELKIADKVKKLLALATSPNPNEAASALAKAQKLMAEYNIVLKDEVAAVDTITVSEQTKGVSVLRKTMASSLAAHFGCMVLISTSRNLDGWAGQTTQRIKFIGTPLNTSILLEVFEYSWNCFIKESDRLLKEHKHYTVPMKNQMKQDYLFGFCNGIVNELIRSENEFGLVVIIPDEVVKHVRSITTGTSVRKNLASSSSSAARGYNDGSFAIRNKNKAVS